MPSPSKGPRLGGGPAHERLILSNLATSLFEHDQITTTAARAKRLRPLAERMVTFAKRGDLASRRRVLTVVRDKGVVHRLFTEVAPDMAERHGGYTRITKIGPRKGDNAPMAVIELVREPLSAKQATVREAEAATQRGAKEAAVAAEAATGDEAPTAAEAVQAEQAEPEASEAEATESGSTDATSTEATRAEASAEDVEPAAGEAPAEEAVASEDSVAETTDEPGEQSEKSDS